MKSLKKVIVIGVAVLIVLRMQTESFAGEDWEVGRSRGTQFMK